MSLFNLIHKSVVFKFSDCDKNQFDPTASYVFRLTAVDGMGFLEIQDLKPGKDGEYETASEPYWINKDAVREIREFKPEETKRVLSTGQATKPQAAKAAVDQVRREVALKPAKAKAPAKPKPVLN